MARPAAEVAACCSAMPTSKVRSGNRAWNWCSPTGCIIAAVIATTSWRRWPIRDDLVGERVGPDAALGVLLARVGVERPDLVELVGLVPLRGVVAEPLAGDRVHDHRAVELLGLGQRLLHRRPVVAVDRADVLQPEVLEEPLRRDGVLDALLHRVQGVVRRRADARHGVEPPLDHVEHLLVARAGAQRGERGGEPADGRRVGAAVVVDDDHQPRPVRDGDVVERLPGHAAGERAVADHRDDVPVLAADRVGLGQPVGVAQRGRGVAVLDDVVRRLGLARVAAQPALDPQPVELAGPSGEHLVHVGLVAGVPHDPVARRVEDAVDGHGQLDHAEVGAEVAADRRAGGDQPVADLAGEGRRAGRRRARAGRAVP